MKLVEIAKNATSILKEAGEKGINNIELAEKLQIPRRRVYDIIAILRAAGLVELQKEKGGTRVSWGSIPTIEPPTPAPDVSKESEKLKDQISKLEKENEDLKDKIKRLQKDLSKGDVAKTSEKKLFDTTGIVVRAAKSLKITGVETSGIEVSITVNGKGILVEPLSDD